MIALISSFLLSTTAMFQTVPAPTCDTEEYRQFDFWIGEWNVHDVNGVLQGTNIITQEENGCLILEKWTSSQDVTGQSYNYFDPAKQKWRQVWVSGGALIDYEGGLDETGAMVLEGTITYQRVGTTAPFRGTWEPQEDGAVIQFFEQYNNDTEEWDTWFLGRYTRIPAEKPVE